MGRFLASLEYDGTHFSGSQVQAGQRTVQGEVERALATLEGRPGRVLFSGRTDSGVHASGQVIGLDLSREMDSAGVASALNGLMDRDVSVREAAAVPDGFHPRYWAQSRRYVYRILVTQQRSALLDRWMWHLPERLDLDAMLRAAECLVGRHDFGAFGRPPQGSNTWRTISRADLAHCGGVLTLTLEADAFLRRMVRTIAGTLVTVGRGRLTWDALGQTVERGSGRVGAAAPAKGLTLAAVCYDRDRLGYGTGRWWSDEPLAVQHDKM